ncbi:hypothetical protein ACFWTE_22770 [Nocardiopsis sp. NPDC058631]|uniref:hypothetical protein n=1 Tax=Nocardiopsis sp. NPDC058631 TaxID=3346566 RepID=UPI0036674564
MSSPTSWRSRRTGLAWVRILLLAALVLGLGAMHTLGHPHEDAHGGGHEMAALVTGPEPGHATVDSDPPPTDPTVVCLAITGLAIALLGVAAVAFTPWPEAPQQAVRRLRRSLRDLSPPPGSPSLAQLQVFRI